LPWHLPGELKHFRQITVDTDALNKPNAVVMGRTTWESLPEKFRPLPKRVNIVLTKNTSIKLPSGVFSCESFDKLEELLKSSSDQYNHIYIIGGAKVYQEAIQHPLCERLFVTHILQSFDCDTYFPTFTDRFEKFRASYYLTEDSITYYFAEYRKKTLAQIGSI
jgi:dihydrofolate reductase